MNAIAPLLPRPPIFADAWEALASLETLFEAQMPAELSKTLSPSSRYVPLTERLAPELERYQAECAYPNWDAYDAEPLLPETVAAARDFLSKLPNALRAPEVFVDPGGELFFEWENEKKYRAVAFINSIGRVSCSLSEGGEPTFDYGYLPNLPNNLRKFLATHFSL